MKYDFDKITVRRGTNCVKWDHEPPVPVDMDKVIPMWVADMDFEVLPEIQEAIKKRAQHPVFGYNTVPDEYYEAIVNWFDKRHGWKIQKDWIQYTLGIVPAMSAVVRALVEPGKKVVILTPAYNCFFPAITNNDCTVVECPLVYKDRYHTIDFELFEKICADPDVKMFLFCNPHNPSGRVWTVEELTKIGEICRKHDVIVTSDEIHCELVMPGYKYTPFASISQANQDCCVSMNAASKAFNVAGLQIGNIVTNNPEWKSKINRAINVMEICDVNPFGHLALVAAYSKSGAEWLDQLNEYIYGNYKMLCDMFAAEIPEFPVSKMEGTYLPWVDCGVLGGLSSVDIENSLLQNEFVWINCGKMYGKEGFIRINLAAPRSLVEEGLRRVIHGLKRLEGKI